MIFFSTVAGYNAYWLLSKFLLNDSTNPAVFIGNNKIAFSTFMIAFLATVFFFFELKIRGLYFLVAIFLLSIYSIPVFYTKFLEVFRKIFFLKTCLLAFAWAFVTVLLPLKEMNFLLGYAGIALFVQRCLFMLILCIIFDNRDIKIDQVKGLQTNATMGIRKKIKVFTLLIFILLAIVNWLLPYFGISEYQSLSLQICLMLTYYIYRKSDNKQSYIFYYFLVDGLMFISALLTELASI